MAEFPVVDLTQDDAPEWLADLESRFFRTAHDTGANPNALLIWNLVREQYGLEPLTEDALWQRHADEAGWSEDDLIRERAEWTAFNEWRVLCQIRDAYQQNHLKIEEMPQTNEEFFATRETESTPE